MYKVLILIFISLSFSAFAAESGREYIERLVHEGRTPFEAMAKVFKESTENVSLEEYAPSCTDKCEIIVDSNLRSTDFYSKNDSRVLNYTENEQISCRLISRTDKSKFSLWGAHEKEKGTNYSDDITLLDGSGWNGYLQSVDPKSKSLRIIAYPGQTSRVFTVRKFRELFITQQIDKERGICNCESENGRVVIEAYRFTWKEKKVL